MSIISHATEELARVNFGEEDSNIMIGLLKTFLEHWDSGGAVWAALPIFCKLMMGQPLSPLTGADDEWMEVSTKMFQNRRCSSVFKNVPGYAYDISTDGRPAITFPYLPKTINMPLLDPCIMVDTDGS